MDEDFDIAVEHNEEQHDERQRFKQGYKPGEYLLFMKRTKWYNRVELFFVISMLLLGLVLCLATGS